MALELIKSFQVDHTTLKKGMYISRIDGDVTTYDLRFKVPNAGDYLDNAALHTIEHIVATYLRNSNQSEKIIYFGPMGCRTGFYFLSRNLEHNAAIELIKNAFSFVADFKGDIPGAAIAECGNYLNQDLVGAQREAVGYLEVLKSVTVESLEY
jgi:S-ribosylhomocysteine lyase